jgi:hypothetical protein
VLPKPPNRDQAKRIVALGAQALSNASGTTPYITAILAWKSGEVAAAYSLAKEILVKDPSDFRMLLICLDHHIRARDSDNIKTFAQRLLKSQNPAGRLRIWYITTDILLFPLRILGIGKRMAPEADTYDEWVTWAKEYVAAHPEEERVHSGA